MTFPQPNSGQAVLDNTASFFRLKTQVGSAGDIYESEVGSVAVALGPDSDLSRVAVYYYDPLDRYYQPSGNVAVALDGTKVSKFVISPDRTMAGIVGAQMDKDYPLYTLTPGRTQLSNRKARILFAPADTIDTVYQPTGFNAAEDIIVYEPIIVDIMQYFAPTPTIYPARSDRLFAYQYLQAPPAPIAAGASTWLVLPAYGRKSGFFTFKNLDGVNTVTVFVSGVRLSSSKGAGALAGFYQQQLFTQALLTTQQGSYVWKSSDTAAAQGGLWDVFVVELRNYIGASFPMTISLSDDAL